jgi:Aspartic acid proteinase inhibitor
MKKSLQVLSVLVALGIMFGCATVGLAQRVGGWKTAEPGDADVQAAAEFAVSAQKEKQDGPLSLVSIKQAERQSVAGVNYRLCLEVKAADETDAGVESQTVQAVVFRSLQNEYRLTSWAESDCGGSDSEGNHATRPAVSVAGVYENFTVGQGSGDLEGMRVVIVQAGGGHHAIVQVAQGGAEDPQPEFVAVNVNGMNVDFTAASTKYTGTVTATELKLKNADGDTQTLKRKPCASYFK